MEQVLGLLEVDLARIKALARTDAFTIIRADRLSESQQIHVRLLRGIRRTADSLSERGLNG